MDNVHDVQPARTFHGLTSLSSSPLAPLTMTTWPLAISRSNASSKYSRSVDRTPRLTQRRGGLAMVAEVPADALTQPA